jgi:hypothetical protein
MLGPNDAVDRFRGCVPYSTAREGFLRSLRITLVTLSPSLGDQLYLAIVTCSSALYQRDFSGQTQSVDVVASSPVVQGIQNYTELLEEVDIVLRAVRNKSGYHIHLIKD